MELGCLEPLKTEDKVMRRFHPEKKNCITNDLAP